MPSARTPTTSKRWTTALSRKRFGPADDVGEADQRRAEEAEQADQGAPDSRRSTRRVRRACAGSVAPLFGADLDRLVGLGDLLEQALGLRRACADDLRAAVADRAIDEPGADRVHPLDARQVDDQRIGHRVDLALDARGARDRQRARGCGSGASSAVGGGCGLRRPCARGHCAKSTGGQVERDRRHFPAAVLAFMRSRNGDDSRNLCSCPSGPTPRACSEWMRATRACRLADEHGPGLRRRSRRGPRRRAREHGLRLGPGLAAGDCAAAGNRADAGRQAGARPCSRRAGHRRGRRAP